MNKKFTELTTVFMMTALCALPLAGQERGIVKMESALHESVQLRADDAEALPDSAIRYFPDGQRQAKYVYAGENLGTYTRENNAWLFESTEVETGFITGAKYGNGFLLTLREVSYEIHGEELHFYIPTVNMSYMYYTFPASMDRMDPKAEYDANGNLTSFQLMRDGNNVEVEFTVSYDTKNNPVDIEGQYPGYDIPLCKAHYEYNDAGYLTLFDHYKWDDRDDIWVNDSKETIEYDMQSKPLNVMYYEYNEITHMLSFKYYDGEHYSSYSFDDYRDESNSWKFEYKYGADGKPGARYNYRGGELSTYYILYPNTLDNPGNANEPPADMRIWSYGGTLHVRTAQPVVLHVYTLTGILHAQQTLPAGETVLPLPPGMYVVRIGNVVRKAVIR
jgi:hypothetical protein